MLLRLTEVEFYLQLHALIMVHSDDPTKPPWAELQIFSEDPASDVNWRKFMAYRDAAGAGALAAHRYGHPGEPTHGLSANIAGPPPPPLDRTREGKPGTGGQILFRGAEALSEADQRALRMPSLKLGMTDLHDYLFMAGCGRTLENHQDLVDKAGSSGRYPSAIDASSPMLFTLMLGTPSLYLEPAPGVYQRVTSYPPSAATTVPDATWGEASLLVPHMGHAGDTRYMRTSSWSKAPWGNVIHVSADSLGGGGGGVTSGGAVWLSHHQYQQPLHDVLADTTARDGSSRRRGGGGSGSGTTRGGVGAALFTVTFASQVAPGATTAPSPVRGGRGGDEGGGGDDVDHTDVPPTVDHTVRSTPLATVWYALLALFVLPTITQRNFTLRCQLLECLLLCGVLWLARWSAAPTADRMQRRAQWLLSLLRPHITACVLLLSHLWSRDCWGVTVVARYSATRGQRVASLLRQCPRPSWPSMGGSWLVGQCGGPRAAQVGGRDARTASSTNLPTVATTPSQSAGGPSHNRSAATDMHAKKYYKAKWSSLISKALQGSGASSPPCLNVRMSRRAVLAWTYAYGCSFFTSLAYAYVPAPPSCLSAPESEGRSQGCTHEPIYYDRQT